MKVGDKIKHIRSGQISVITKIGSPTVYFKVISLGDTPVPGVKVNDHQKTNIHAIGKLYDIIKENKMKKLTAEQKIKVKGFIKRLQESKIINENNTYTMISALREIVDDLLLGTELLIDNEYGKLEHKEFKDAWYKTSNTFEKKFKSIIKNLMIGNKK